MTDNQTEYRTSTETWPLENMELRTVKDGLRFSGYAAVFGVDSVRFRLPNGVVGVEQIRSGAFTKSLAERRTTKLFINHDMLPVLASTASGTLKLTEDKRGLKAEADLPDNEWGRPVADAIRRGDIDSMSFSFDKIRDQYPQPDRRMLGEVRIGEVSIVTALEAYPATTTSVRSLMERIPEELRSVLSVLASPDERLNPEQVALLLSTIEEHRQRPSSADRLAQWREQFALA